MAANPTTITNQLFDHAKFKPNHPAVVSASLSLSYFELANAVLAQATALKKIGVSKASTIGIETDDDISHLVLCLATLHIGAISCAIPTTETVALKASFAERCDVTQNIGNDTAIDLTATHLTPSGPSESTSNHLDNSLDATLLFSTSGTTGAAKIVELRSSDIAAQAHRHIESPDQRFACTTSINHNFVKRHRLYCVAQGATNVFLDTPSNTMIEQCIALNVNVLHVSTFQAQQLLAAPHVDKLAQIRLKLGGSHAPTALRQQLQRNVTTDLRFGYGTTETGAIAFTQPDDIDSGESVGKALPGIDIKITDANRAALPTGERGEIAIRAPGMFRGYKKAPDKYRKCVMDDWFFTGDIGYLDDQGKLTLCGRSDDMFVFNSMNIYPHDIESQIRLFPDVIDAAVLPKPSTVHGNIPVALVVIAADSPTIDLHSLKKFMKARAGLRSPRLFKLVSRIPRNPSGKILRAEAIELIA